MKIFVINTVIPPGIDGSIVHRWELVKNLASLGHEVHTISNGEYKSVKYDGIYFHVDPESNLDKRKSFDRSLHQFMYAIFLLKLIKKNRFDVLYTRTPYQMNGIVGYIAKKLMRLPLIFEINGIAFDELKLERDEPSSSRRNVVDSIKIEFRKRKEIFMWNKADALIAVTDGIKRYLVRHGVDENKIWVIGNGANTELFKPMDQNVVRSKLGLDPVNKYVCFVGNLAPWQGVEYLIQAAPSVLERIPEVKFLIVGDGVMRDKLEKMVSDLGLDENFIFTGTVPYADVPKYINASDVCVAPFITARNEKIGLSPLKLYEYLACGKPVVGSDMEGVGNFLENSNAGISFTSEDPIGFANAIKKILIDKNSIGKTSKSGRQIVVEKYSWEKVAGRVENICNGVIRSKRKHESD